MTAGAGTVEPPTARRRIHRLAERARRPYETSKTREASPILIGMTSGLVVHDTTAQPVRRWSILVAAAGVVLPGFVALALLGSLRNYAYGLPGFWDYPSGTIGDALLVPGIIVGLLVQAQALRAWRAPSERVRQIIGGAVGAAGGAVVPVSWYLDPHARHIWMLPRAHHYLLAGWWHLVYLTAATGALGYLMVTVLGRLRRAPAESETRLPSGYRPDWMTLVVGAGLGMLVLIGRDAVVGGKTAASATTVASLAIVAFAFLGGLAWAARPVRWRRILTSALIIAAFLISLLGVIVHWAPHDPVIVGVGALTAALVCLAATSQLVFHPKRSSYRWPTALAMTTAATAGLIRSTDAYVHGHPRPLIGLVAAVVLACVLLAIVDGDCSDAGRLTRYALFLGYCLFTYYLAARMRSATGEHSAGASVSVANTAFDVMVFTLIQSRFAELGKADEIRVKAEFVTSPGQLLEASAPDRGSGVGPVVVDMLLLGVAVGLSLFMLLVVAARPLGLDRNAVAPSPVRG